MIIKREKVPYTAFLPAAKCRQDVYDAVAKIAEDEKCSKAEVIRNAVEFFLQQYSQKSGNTISTSGEVDSPTKEGGPDEQTS